MIEKANLEVFAETLLNLAKKSNILTLHIHFDQKNQAIINDVILNNLKQPSFLINTSRGELIDEANLIKLIKNKRISGCGLDTVNSEFSEKFRTNPKQNKLIKLFNTQIYNLFITPKIGGAVKEAWEITENYLIDELIKKHE